MCSVLPPRPSCSDTPVVQNSPVIGRPGYLGVTDRQCHVPSPSPFQRRESLPPCPSCPCPIPKGTGGEARASCLPEEELKGPFLWSHGGFLCRLQQQRRPGGGSWGAAFSGSGQGGGGPLVGVVTPAGVKNPLSGQAACVQETKWARHPLVAGGSGEAGLRAGDSGVARFIRVEIEGCPVSHPHLSKEKVQPCLHQGQGKGQCPEFLFHFQAESSGAHGQH